MWFPPLPNKGEVRIEVEHLPYTDVHFCERYHTLNIEPIIEYDGKQHYLANMFINSDKVIPESKLYLGENIKVVILKYKIVDTVDMFGGVVESYTYLSLANYLPQLTNAKNAISFPRGSYYAGVKMDDIKLPVEVFAFPVDLDKEDFEIWRNGIKFTLRLNRANKVQFYEFTYSKFDMIKAEFYGELLPAEKIDDYVELKPKGA